ncbi:NUDIX hydrolase [Variovorax sp. HJSM1_2]|uniref:NUDIX hydrolase n=1 Tax=Variovorax sp. HJSM1_2 TaxID=3366263 RepID=UPI003BCA222B
MKNRWKPSVTVAAVIEKNGQFLLVEEHTPEGLRLNNPAGHLESGESLVEACVREVLEETSYSFTPTALVGVYMSRVRRAGQNGAEDRDITYLRFAFCGKVGAPDSTRRLDHGIVRTHWMTATQIQQHTPRHRTPLLQRGLDDYLAGRRFPLDFVNTDASVYLSL